MTDSLFERLLYEEESTMLDFKKGQYRFAKASEEDKSELLKDILGFANSWRRAEAHILIGVEDVRGGRGNVTGIPATAHLDDHALQQFVNNLTNRPVRFHYEALGFEGKQVGIVHIDEQQARPLYLKADYGKLKKTAVYVRRGSSTDPTKPAMPEEIALMGKDAVLPERGLVLAVEFASTDRDEVLGAQTAWAAELCVVPNEQSIPTFEDRPSEFALGGQIIRIPTISSFDYTRQPNKKYYRDTAEYVFMRKFFREVRLVVTNNGTTAASDVRIEIRVGAEEPYRVVASRKMPDRPAKYYSHLERFALGDIEPARPFRRHGYVEVSSSADESKVQIECGDIQPGRKIWTDPFHVGVAKTCAAGLTGDILAANLPRPQRFSLTIDATIERTALDIGQLVSYADAEIDLTAEGER